MLQADPHTDWSKVNIDALRQHLIDMDEVTLHAVTRNEPVDGGLRVRVTGSGRTLEAIQRMVPDHAREIDGMFGWTVRATPVPDGVELTVITAKAADVQQIRALGFMGIMVQGGHHPIHHKAMASGEMTHSHWRPKTPTADPIGRWTLCPPPGSSARAKPSGSLRQGTGTNPPWRNRRQTP